MAFHYAFIKPAGLGIGTLGFLVFGTAGTVAWRGAVYLFGGMVGEEKYGENGENDGGGVWMMGREREGKGRNGGKIGQCHGQCGPTQLFASSGAPSRPPTRWVRLVSVGVNFDPNRRKTRLQGRD